MAPRAGAGPVLRQPAVHLGNTAGARQRGGSPISRIGTSRHEVLPRVRLPHHEGGRGRRGAKWTRSPPEFNAGHGTRSEQAALRGCLPFHATARREIAVSLALFSITRRVLGIPDLAVTCAEHRPREVHSVQGHTAHVILITEACEDVRSGDARTRRAKAENASYFGPSAFRGLPLLLPLAFLTSIKLNRRLYASWRPHFLPIVQRPTPIDRRGSCTPSFPPYGASSPFTLGRSHTRSRIPVSFAPCRHPHPIPLRP